MRPVTIGALRLFSISSQEIRRCYSGLFSRNVQAQNEKCFDISRTAAPKLKDLPSLMQFYEHLKDNSRVTSIIMTDVIKTCKRLNLPDFARNLWQDMTKFNTYPDAHGMDFLLKINTRTPKAILEIAAVATKQQIKVRT
jgi:hypothetical protein